MGAGGGGESLAFAACLLFHCTLSFCRKRREETEGTPGVGWGLRGGGGKSFRPTLFKTV